jgi:hypothetical protein
VAVLFVDLTADSSVLVGDVDTAPDQATSAWDVTDGHGTHTAGTIAAAANGIVIHWVFDQRRAAKLHRRSWQQLVVR